ncbi:hypothetical protein BTM36_03025 [Herbaspirillum sp. VT-16-41]|nr:hypothetical protein BTM36_03025 [Herbaspirillum sp. VT-16-41]
MVPAIGVENANQGGTQPWGSKRTQQGEPVDAAWLPHDDVSRGRRLADLDLMGILDELMNSVAERTDMRW